MATFEIGSLFEQLFEDLSINVPQYKELFGAMKKLATVLKQPDRANLCVTTIGSQSMNSAARVKPLLNNPSDTVKLAAIKNYVESTSKKPSLHGKNNATLYTHSNTTEKSMRNKRWHTRIDLPQHNPIIIES